MRSQLLPPALVRFAHHYLQFSFIRLGTLLGTMRMILRRRFDISFGWCSVLFPPVIVLIYLAKDASESSSAWSTAPMFSSSYPSLAAYRI